MKVLWRNHSEEEATWEMESEMRIKYPHLFENEGEHIFKFGGPNFLRGEECNVSGKSKKNIFSKEYMYIYS